MRTPLGAPGIAEYVLLGLLAAIWGSAFMFIKIAVATVPPATITLGRMVIATAMLVPIAVAAGRALPRDPRIYGFIALAGLFGNALPFTLIAWGQQEIDSGLAAILMGAMPLFTLLLAHMFTADEKLNVLKVIAVGFGFAGMIMLIGPAKLAGLGAQVIAQLAVACGAVCYAVNAIITRHLSGLPRRAVAASVMASSAVMMLPVAFISDLSAGVGPVLAQASWGSLGAVVLLGVLHTGLATLIMFRIVAGAGATFFSQINFLVPLFGVAWGALLLGERPQVNAYIALALILIGIAIAQRAQQARRVV